MAHTSYARTLSQIVNETYRICGDVIPGGIAYGQTWRWAEVASSVNQATLEAVDRAGALREAGAIIPLYVGINVYNLPVDCVRLLRVGLHGYNGWVVMPMSVTEMDLIGADMCAWGIPLRFFREFLAPNQIGVYPAPGQDEIGADGIALGRFTRDSPYGLLREIRDADGHVLPYDANHALRQIRGVPFMRRGDGQIIREILSTGGTAQVANLVIHYVRTPAWMVEYGDYPDYELPEWFHHNIKYGAASILLRYQRNKLDQFRAQRFKRKWQMSLLKLQHWIEHQGPMNASFTPL